MALLREIIGSFSSGEKKGIPIGNLTSQLFANVYMNALDQCMKHTMKVRYYLRYTDDFVIVSETEKYLRDLLPHIRSHLHDRLQLQLHPHKVTLRKFRQGVDFLGYVLLPHHRMLRATTKRRMIRKLQNKRALCEREPEWKGSLEQTLQSYLGVLSHANAHRLGEDLKNQFSFTGY